MKKLARLFLYCGVSKEEYNSVKKEAYVSNFNVWKFLHVFITITFGIVFIETLGRDGVCVDSMLRLFVVLYCVTVTILFHRVLRPDSLAGQFIIYLTMILLLIMAFYLSLERSGMMAVSFVALLVLLPTFMIDKPYFMAILLTASATIYLCHATMFKSGDALLGDFINVIGYGALGIVINAFINSIRVREFLLTKQVTAHLEEQRHTIEETKRMNDALQNMSESLIDMLGNVVESRNVESGEHVKRVRGFTYILANQVMRDLPEYGLDNYTVRLMTFASALHDVGKISIPDSVLLKPGRLTAEEFDLMKTHCDRGCDILKKMAVGWDSSYLEMGLSICGSHHEKWDGKGYPRGLKGDEIPIAAQIVSIADVFDALTSDRVYKKACTCEKAFEMIRNGECGAYSEKLLACLDQCREAFISHRLDPERLETGDTVFQVTTTGAESRTGFVVGLHDQDRTLRENLQLNEELQVIKSFSEEFCYIGYVDPRSNEVRRYRAEPFIAQLLDAWSYLPSNLRFDRLLNTIILPEDMERFRAAVDREKAMETLKTEGNLAVSFRVRTESGVRIARMRIFNDPLNSGAVVVGIILLSDGTVNEIGALIGKMDEKKEPPAAEA